LLLSLLAATWAHAQVPGLLVPPVKAAEDAPALAPLQAGAASLEDWNLRRIALRERWQARLGRFPVDRAELKLEVVATEELPGFTRQHVRYQVEEGVMTDGYLLTPRPVAGRTPRPAQERFPAVVVFHQTTRTQAQQVAGIDASNPELMQGVQLVQRGYVVLAPRCFIFAEGGDYAGHVGIMKQRHPDWTGMARMTWDGIRAMDVLVSLPNVDPGRIGGIGHSLGAKEVLYAAAFDERYKVAVFSEGGIGLRFSNWDAMWYLGPQIREPAFTLEHHELMALIAPRGFLLLAGDSADGDRSWPFVEAVMPVYRLHGAERSIGWLNHRTGHRYPPEAQAAAEEFLDAHLRPGQR
jgi:hypothetical protein